MRNGVVGVPRHLGQQAVPVHEDELVAPLFHHLVFKGRIHPDVGADGDDAIKLEKLVSLAFGADAVVPEHVPQLVVFLPVAELHVEGAVKGLIMHLGVEALPIGHGAFPFLTDRFDFCHAAYSPFPCIVQSIAQLRTGYHR